MSEIKTYQSFAIGNGNIKKSGTQGLLFGNDSLQQALHEFSEAGNSERGAISTKTTIVNFILDLIGYTSDKPLIFHPLLEPSFGDGQFLMAATRRLLESCKQNKIDTRNVINRLHDSLRGVELNSVSFNRTKEKLHELLISSDIPDEDSVALVKSWLIHSDFLLTDFSVRFSYIAGNPPYVRQELIPDILLSEYRRRFDTIYDRADLYIPFIEKSLQLLLPLGSLGFICSDRWMKNKYGGPLRKRIDENYHLKYFIDMVDTDSFVTDVSAYPAITVIVNEKSGPTRIAHRPRVDSSTLTDLSEKLKSENSGNDQIIEVGNVTDGAEPWILDSFDQLDLIRRLEREFPLIEQTGCTIGIGVATGADKVFVKQSDELDIEPERKLKLVTTEDIKHGQIQWTGKSVLNPFNDDGSLVSLTDYPKLHAYLRSHEELLVSRHVAKQNPSNWYRTIDRIKPELLSKPKLLIPDIKGSANIVYDEGYYYPHHNLYYITSETWDLRALQAVLVSGIARLFISVYSTKIRGGYLRFQAQYLRRIRLPYWNDVPQTMKADLVNAATNGDIEACNMTTFTLFGLSGKERVTIGKNGAG